MLLIGLLAVFAYTWQGPLARTTLGTCIVSGTGVASPGINCEMLRLQFYHSEVTSGLLRLSTLYRPGSGDHYIQTVA